MSRKIAYIDCSSGASGDMLLGGLVDAGLPLEQLAADLATLSCGDEIELRAEVVQRGGIRATKLHVETSEGTTPPHRNLEDIRHIILNSPLPKHAKEHALHIFTCLGEAEARVHNVPIDQIHFHEVGAVDSIADIVGFACALERMGIDEIRFGTLRLGGGTVQTAHGVLPVPAPATAELITGFRAQMGPVEAELLTPTAAAILTTLGIQQDPPPFKMTTAGNGAGSADFPNHPNVVRVMIGDTDSDEACDAVWVVEANLDDTTPEICGHAIDRLLAAGALDAYAIPIQMKKSRPGFMLCAISNDEALARVEETFFQETTTFGLRRRRAVRTKLDRQMVQVETPYGRVRVKLGKRNGKIITRSPEYEDCRRRAHEHNAPLRKVFEAATRPTPPRRRETPAAPAPTLVPPGAARTAMGSDSVEVETPYGKVRIRIGKRDGKTVTLTPEYEDCRRLAVASGVSLRKVFRTASKAAAKL